MTKVSQKSIQSAADALRSARESRVPIPPVSTTFGIAGLEAAYKISGVNHQARLAEGRRIVGLKVGLTSKAVQQQLGVDQPDFGLLFDDMECLNGQEVNSARLMQPKVEAEVAFVVGRDLHGIRPSYSEFLAAIAYALPAIEIVDSAIADWRISLVDTIADNASSGMYVLGDQPLAIGQLQLGDLGMTLQKNGQTAAIGTGAACLGHPLRAAYWLACTFGQLGNSLKAGQVILSGALGPMVPVVKSDLVHVHIGSLGDVSCRMG